MSTEPVSRADAIAEAIRARLAVILTDNGYTADLGATVYRGRRPLKPEELPALVLVEDEDEIGDQAGAHIVARLPFTVHAVSTCAPDTESRIAHQMVADLKRCLFDPEWVRTLTDQKLIDPKFGVSYTGRIITPREEGSNAIEVAVRLRVWYAEELTRP